jgi:hypothetical protein
MSAAAAQELPADEGTGPTANQELKIGGEPRPQAETSWAYWKRTRAEKERSLRDLADSGDVNAERELAIWLVGANRVSEGEHLLRTAAITGDAAALRLLGPPRQL